jgi:hypothetical protein
VTSRKPDWVALWGDLHYPGRRRTLRNFLCELGLHWPITGGEIWQGSYAPPEYGWSCDTCGHERYPYRAWTWREPWCRFIPGPILKRL